MKCIVQRLAAGKHFLRGPLRLCGAAHTRSPLVELRVIAKVLGLDGEVRATAFGSHLEYGERDVYRPPGVCG